MPPAEPQLVQALLLTLFAALVAWRTALDAGPPLRLRPPRDRDEREAAVGRARRGAVRLARRLQEHGARGWRELTPPRYRTTPEVREELERLAVALLTRPSIPAPVFHQLHEFASDPGSALYTGPACRTAEEARRLRLLVALADDDLR
jgi:hypothetical protein